MSGRQSLNLCSVVLGLAGAVFLAKGVLFSNPQVIAEQVKTKFDFSRELLTGLAGQRGDYIVGVALVLLAFFAQAAVMVLEWRPTRFAPNGPAAVVWIVAILLLTLVFSELTGRAIGRHQGRLVGEQLTRDFLLQVFQDRKVDPFELQGMIQYHNQLLGHLKGKADSESARAYIERLAKSLGLAVPPDLDWTAGGEN